MWAAQVEGPGGFVKPLALKFILESFAADPELERLFVNEARLAARLQHANLVAVFDFDRMQESEGALPGRYYIAMERVDGHDLRRVVQAAALRTRRIPPSIALYVAGEVLRGLRYVHERRDEPSGKRLELVHRDVSPHNVLIGMGGEVKLSDFGIAKARALHHTVDTRAGTVRGKLAYAAPEQLRSESLDHRADQFAMGIVLWELLAGRRLFDGASEMEIAEKVLAGEIPPLPAAAGVAPAVEDIARRMLSARPRDRFASTAEALSAVMAAPGYRADPAPLVDLMHALFPPQHLPVAPTAPVVLPDPVALALPQKRQMPPTMPMDMGQGARAPAAAAIAAGAVTVNRPLFESSGHGSGSYVSDVGASPWSRAARGRARAVGSPARRLVVGLVAVALVGGGAGVAIRRLRAARMKNTTAATGTTTEAGAGATASAGATGTDSVSPPAASAVPLSGSAVTAPELPKPSPPLPVEAPPDDQPGRQRELSGPPATPALRAASPPTQVEARPFPPAVSPLGSDRAVSSAPTALAPIPPAPLSPPPAPPPTTAPEAAVTPPFLATPPPATPPAAAKQRKGTAPTAAPILE